MMSDDKLKELQAMNYPVKIWFDPEENVYNADFFDLPGCSASGDTLDEAYERAQEAKNEWLRISSAEGLPIPKPQANQEYSGRILARVPSSLHAMLSDNAKMHGVSLNQYVVHLLSAGIVGDGVSAELEQLKSKISHLEWRIAQLAVTVKPEQVQVSNIAAKTFVSTALPYAIPATGYVQSFGGIMSLHDVQGASYGWRYLEPDEAATVWLNDTPTLMRPLEQPRPRKLPRNK